MADIASHKDIAVVAPLPNELATFYEEFDTKNPSRYKPEAQKGYWLGRTRGGVPQEGSAWGAVNAALTNTITNLYTPGMNMYFMGNRDGSLFIGRYIVDMAEKGWQINPNLVNLKDAEIRWSSKKGTFSQEGYRELKRFTSSRGAYTEIQPEGQGITAKDYAKRNKVFLDKADAVFALWPRQADWNKGEVGRDSANILRQAEKAGKDILIVDPRHKEEIIWISGDKSIKDPIQVYKAKYGQPLARLSIEKEAEVLKDIGFKRDQQKPQRQQGQNKAWSAPAPPASAQPNTQNTQRQRATTRPQSNQNVPITQRNQVDASLAAADAARYEARTAPRQATRQMPQNMQAQMPNEQTLHSDIYTNNTVRNMSLEEAISAGIVRFVDDNKTFEEKPKQEEGGKTPAHMAKSRQEPKEEKVQQPPAPAVAAKQTMPFYGQIKTEKSRQETMDDFFSAVVEMQAGIYYDKATDEMSYTEDDGSWSCDSY